MPWTSVELTDRHPSIRKSWQYNSATSGGRSGNIVHLLAKSQGFCCFLYSYEEI
jgi:hypothetical protein